MIRHGTPAFLEAFGAGCVGQPAREAMADLPGDAFELLDRVLRDGRPLARRIDARGGACRLVAAPRVDPGTGEVYGVVVHLRPART